MDKRSRFDLSQRIVGEHSLPGYGPVSLVNRPVRTRMPGGVGAGGEIPPASALVSASNQRGESPLQADALRPVTDSNCVAARRGGEQQEVNDQSVG